MEGITAQPPKAGDVAPRWDYDAFQFAAVDLNSLLFMMEINMNFFAKTIKMVKKV